MFTLLLSLPAQLLCKDYNIFFYAGLRHLVVTLLHNKP
jgi:hypothetical protein